MRIVFMGTPDFAAGILAAVLDAGYPVAAVVTQPDRPKGRRREPVPCPVKELATSRGIPALTPERVRRPEEIEKIRALAPDLILVAAFGQILPKELLDIPQYGCLNVHASLLPAYRGAAPIQHAILDGCKETGVSIMQMDEGLDTGAVLAQRSIPIDPEDTGGTLFDKLMSLGAELLMDTLPKVGTGELVPVPQPKESATPYAAMLKKEDGRIDWTETAEVIERKVRAFSPWPGAYTTLDGKNLRIWTANVVFKEPVILSEAKNLEDGLPEKTDEDSPTGKEPVILSEAKNFEGRFPQEVNPQPGTLTRLPDGTLAVQTGKGLLLPLEVQLEGKRRMTIQEFLRGYRMKEAVLGI